MKRSSKKHGGGGSAWWWFLTAALAAVVAWLFWHYSQSPAPKRPTQAPAGTNRLDRQLATNVLRWLETNFADPDFKPVATNAAAKPSVVAATNAPPRTNAVALTNRTVTLAATNPPVTIVSAGSARPVRDVLEAQIALARLGISSGPVDGVAGSQTRSALRAFQKQQRLPPTGELDPATRASLVVMEPVFGNYAVTSGDLARLRPVPDTWLEKSEMDALEYETILEMISETHRAHTNLIRRLNPSINWTNVVLHSIVKVPLTDRIPSREKAAFVRIQLSAKTLEAFDSETNLLAHFPCSIAQKVEKRPVGKLLVAKAAQDPNYRFDPEVFPESEEGRRLGRKLMIPPGPNNPVGTAWIGLDRPGYGIHGTPRPEQVGRTESHGCFRLANWNAEHLLELVWAGLPVYVEP